MTTRRDFLVKSGLAASALALTSRQLAAAEAPSPILRAGTQPDPAGASSMRNVSSSSHSSSIARFGVNSTIRPENASCVPLRRPW